MVYSIEEKKQLIQNFWTGFDLFCSRMHFLNGRRKKWLLHRTKINQVHLKFDPGRNSVKVVVELLHRNELKRLEMFEKIEQYKVILEEGFPDGLIWDFAFERDSGQQVCRIYAELKNVDIHRQSQWEVMYEFMAKSMFQLENNFLEIRDLISN